MIIHIYNCVHVLPITSFLHTLCLVHVDLTNSSCTQEYSYWIKDLSLFLVDKESIVGGRWLTDAVITAGQKLLKQAHSY